MRSPMIRWQGRRSRSAMMTWWLTQIRTNDLVDAVRRVAAGQSLLDPGVTERVLERLRRGPVED
jgi:hypothetical protein